MNEALRIGSHVRRIWPPGDYTYGRRGKVEEIIGGRVRVRWLFERDGSSIVTMGAKLGNGIRTWVKRENIEVIIDIYQDI